MVSTVAAAADDAAAKRETTSEADRRSRETSKSRPPPFSLSLTLSHIVPVWAAPAGRQRARRQQEALKLVFDICPRRGFSFWFSLFSAIKSEISQTIRVEEASSSDM